MNSMTRSLLALVVGFTLLLSGAARAQETFDSLGGTWWFKIGGKDKGALFIAFTAPEFGNFAVEDTVTELPSFGFSRTLGAFFRGRRPVAHVRLKGNVSARSSSPTPTRKRSRHADSRRVFNKLTAGRSAR
jgi:hypothetical protein